MKCNDEIFLIDFCVACLISKNFFCFSKMSMIAMFVVVVLARMAEHVRTVLMLIPAHVLLDGQGLIVA